MQGIIFKLGDDNMENNKNKDKEKTKKDNEDLQNASILQSAIMPSTMIMQGIMFFYKR